MRAGTIRWKSPREIAGLEGGLKQSWDRWEREAELMAARLTGRLWAYQLVLKLPTTAEVEVETVTVEELMGLGEELNRQVVSLMGGSRGGAASIGSGAIEV